MLEARGLAAAEGLPLLAAVASAEDGTGGSCCATSVLRLAVLMRATGVAGAGRLEAAAWVGEAEGEDASGASVLWRHGGAEYNRLRGQEL